MKIKVEVDLSGLFPDEEAQSVSDIMRSAIVYDVKKQVLDHFKATVGDEFNKAAIATVEVEKNKMIVSHLEELVNTAEVIKRYSSTEKITVIEYIKEEFERSVVTDKDLDSILKKAVKECAITVVAELKERYDVLFATQIVMKLNEQGMLKDDVAKTLFRDKKEGE